MDSSHDPHGRCLPDAPNPCFKCKAAYWRERGVPMKFTYGRDAFKGPTGPELQRREIEVFRQRNGYDPVPRPQRAELI
jgi:hypothetical protein